MSCQNPLSCLYPYCDCGEDEDDYKEEDVSFGSEDDLAESLYLDRQNARAINRRID